MALYRIVKNVGRRKQWRNWRINGQPLAGENNGELGELMTNRRSFLLKIYGIFNICLLFVGHLPKFSSPNNLNSLIC